MNVIVRPGVSLADFLDWERDQTLRHEFDGTQPIPMTGGTVAHARLVRRIMAALAPRLPPDCEAFGGDLKVFTAPGRVRYPDVLVLRGTPDPTADRVDPVVVFEVLSPSTALADLRVKPEEYASVASIQAYVVLPQDGAAGATILRRANGWVPEAMAADIGLPEIGVTLSLDSLYGA
jgi:Uma2 family endonuclease